MELRAFEMDILPHGKKVAQQWGMSRLDGLLGDVPLWLSYSDTQVKARDIFHRHYVAGWHPGMTGTSFIMKEDGTLLYPGDPAMRPLVRIKHGDEEVFQYEHSWVAIRQPDGSFEVDRMD